MQVPVLSSTVLLTLLLCVGLFFFIRASTKDRIQVARLVADQEEDALLQRLQSYFSERSYRIAGMDAAQQQVTFEGFVQPSSFLAIFLTLLAAVGFLCLSLVLALLFPDNAPLFPALALLSPLAGWFYWKKSGRMEQVLLRVQTLVDPGSAGMSSAKSTATLAPASQSLLTVTAHRDELAELTRALKLSPLETDEA